MDVMKGVEAGPSGASHDAIVPGEKGWVGDGLKDNSKKEKSKKGKGKAEEVLQVEDIAEDDDAAWLKRRQTVLDGEVAEDAAVGNDPS